MARVEVTTWSLEMLDPVELRPALVDDPALEVRRAEIPSPELSRFLYTSVGGDWHWVDRLGWSLERWRQHLERAGVETWVAYLHGTPAGYFELEPESDGSVEISYFGLLPAFRGRGLGGHLLTLATRRAWDTGAARVWLHTASIDGPHARRNYESRGFRVFASAIAVEELPEYPLGPWPGARVQRRPG